MYQLNPASLDSIKELTESKNNCKKSTSKTYKNRKSVNFDKNIVTEKPKLTNISLLHSANEDDDDSQDDFALQYNSTIQQNSILEDNNNENIINSELKKMQIFKSKDSRDSIGTIESGNIYSHLNDTYKAQLPNMTDSNLNKNNDLYVSYNQTNQTNQTNETINNNNNLLNKLDYIIHLLEQQHNEKTNHITEELILYLFLGIFIIYVLDSFTKASKYIR